MISPWMGDLNTLKASGSVVTLRFGGLLHQEIEVLHGRKGWGWVSL